MVSIIIRTKNEERWITPCLSAVFGQDHREFEVILVDNESVDRTVERATRFDIRKVVRIKDYMPGAALNAGIREARGEHVVCLSGHCIPVDRRWLSTLLRNFEDAGVAGVYGRQQPLAFTPASDKRDLAIAFGLDRRVQRRDSFFHNANSVLRRDVWEKFPFDETLTNIEDRAWAKQVLEHGYTIVYEPEASVYHHHGIHHDGNAERCASVVRILETLEPEINGGVHVDVERLNVVALVPVKGEIQSLNGRPLLGYTIDRALESRYVKNVIVSTDNPEIARLAEGLGAKAPFLRDDSLSRDYVDLDEVLRYSLQRVEELGIFPDIVVALEVTFPFRPKGLIDRMILRLVSEGVDTVIAAKRENKSIWLERDGVMARIDEGDVPRQYKSPAYLSLKGLCRVTHPECIRGGEFLQARVGIYEVTNPYASLEVRSQADFEMAGLLMQQWWKSESRC